MDNDRRSKFVTADDEPLEIDRSRASGPNLLAGRSQRLSAMPLTNAEAEVQALAEDLKKEASLSDTQSRAVMRFLTEFTLRNPLIWSTIVKLASRDKDKA
jgi:hypothetical protein